MSIPGRDSTAAMLVRTGFVVVLVPVNVSGFRLVLACGWHGQTSYQGSSGSAHAFRLVDYLRLVVRARPLVSVPVSGDRHSVSCSL